MNTKIKAISLSIALLLLVLGAQSAFAGDEWSDWKASFLLKPAPYGDSLGASGSVNMGRKDSREFLEVQVFAKLPAKTELLVLAMNAKETWFTVGTIQMVEGVGYLQLWQAIGPAPSPLFPLSQLKRMLIYDGKELVLKTSFVPLPGM